MSEIPNQRRTEALILARLRASQGAYLSGEELSEALGLSRTAVWKAVTGLRARGYIIEAAPRRGYALCGLPDRLYPEEIKNGLKTKLLGQKIVYHPSLPSTNTYLKQNAAALPDGAMVVTEEQTAGQGRWGRSWFQPAGEGLTFSLLLRPPLIPKEVPFLALLAGLGLAQGVLPFLPPSLHPSLGLKWPNDLIFQVNSQEEKKLAGILITMGAELERVNYVILGIGLNVNTTFQAAPPEVQARATSLRALAGKPLPRVTILQALLQEIENLYFTFLQAGPAPILQAYRSRCFTLGRQVTVWNAQSQLTGIARDLTPDGSLLLETPTGEKIAVYSGEVSLRPTTTAQ